jgi:hypothetical protein
VVAHLMMMPTTAIMMVMLKMTTIAVLSLRMYLSYNDYYSRSLFLLLLAACCASAPRPRLNIFPIYYLSPFAVIVKSPSPLIVAIKKAFWPCHINNPKTLSKI